LGGSDQPLRRFEGSIGRDATHRDILVGRGLYGSIWARGGPARVRFRAEGGVGLGRELPVRAGMWNRLVHGCGSLSPIRIRRLTAGGDVVD
jgi:hypothetical protein